MFKVLRNKLFTRYVVKKMIDGKWEKWAIFPLRTCVSLDEVYREIAGGTVVYNSPLLEEYWDISTYTSAEDFKAQHAEDFI